ncbi:MAG: hypothetical protein AAGD01_00155 [Acidobacteriota bacterium]
MQSSQRPALLRARPLGRLRALSLGLYLSLGAGLVMGCSAPPEPAESAAPAEEVMDAVAEDYVRLVLGVGLHDEHFVDAYYGPEERRAEVQAAAPSLDELQEQAQQLRERLQDNPLPDEAEELLQLRHRYLDRQLEAASGRLAMLQGEALSFDEESRVLYDAVSPPVSRDELENQRQQLDSVLPGDGDLASRLKEFRDGYIIPTDRLQAVFAAAIESCREQTARYIPLPEGESFTVEYVTDQPWSAYNWYQGGRRSLIQVNTDLPIYIDRALDLACHEGYPGHHVYNLLLETRLVEERGWPEVAIYPLFSPQSLIAEGTANYGIELAFPGEERTRFEAEVLYPLAGLDPSTAARYHEVMESLEGLRYAGNEAARGYLDGELSADEAAQWLVRYALMDLERAQQRVRFFDRYRSYVINYNLGEDLVARHFDALGARPDDPDTRWRLMTELLSTPRLPSDLVGR